jgi:predicted Zn-dependent protease
MQLALAEVPDGTSARDYAALLAQKGLVPQSGTDATINGNPAFIGVYALQSQGTELAAVAAFVEYRQKLFEIIGITPDYRRYSLAMEEAIRSFERVTEQRILRAQPDRLRLYTARQGDTLAGIAERDPNPRVTADDLAVLNRLATNQPIAPGRQLKIVQRGY